MARICPQCQTETSDDAAFCPQCGATIAQSSGPSSQAAAPPTSEPAVYGYVSTPAPSQSTPSTSYNFDIARLSSADRITGIASVVLLIAMFLPWFGYGGYSVDGLSTHGYLYIALLVDIALIVYVGARAGLDNLSINNSFAHAPNAVRGDIGQFHPRRPRLSLQADGIELAVRSILRIDRRRRSRCSDCDSGLPLAPIGPAIGSASQGPHRWPPIALSADHENLWIVYSQELNEEASQ